MKKLIQILITFGLVVVMGGTANGEVGGKKLTKEETVMSSLGPVKLKTDLTYEFISQEGEDGKVVFRIVKGEPHLDEDTALDDMEEFSHYVIWSGCNYTFEIENKTPHKVRLKTFLLNGTFPELHLTKNTMVSMSSSKSLIEPGSKISVSKSLFAKIAKSKTPLTDEEKNNLNKKHGCDAQSGSLSIEKHPSYPSVIIFSEKTGISKETADIFGMGSASGVYPIEKKIR